MASIIELVDHGPASLFQVLYFGNDWTVRKELTETIIQEMMTSTLPEYYY